MSTTGGGIQLMSTQQLHHPTLQHCQSSSEHWPMSASLEYRHLSFFFLLLLIILLLENQEIANFSIGLINHTVLISLVRSYQNIDPHRASINAVFHKSLFSSYRVTRPEDTLSLSTLHSSRPLETSGILVSLQTFEAGNRRVKMDGNKQTMILLP